MSSAACAEELLLIARSSRTSHRGIDVDIDADLHVALMFRESAVRLKRLLKVNSQVTEAVLQCSRFARRSNHGRRLPPQLPPRFKVVYAEFLAHFSAANHTADYRDAADR